MKKSKYIFLITGSVILFVLFRSFGVESTIDQIAGIGWSGFIIICSIYIFSNIALAYGWFVLINYPLKKSHFYKIVLARIAGDSTSSINSLGSAAGEVLKAMYVKDILPINAGLATVFLDRLIHLVSGVLMILTGIFAGLFVFKSHMIETIAVFIFLALIFFLILNQSFKFAIKYSDNILLNLITKLPIGLDKKILTEKNIGKISLIDNEIKFVYSSRDNLNHFYISLAMHYFGTIIACALEIYLIINFISPATGISITEGLFIYIFGFIATNIFFFIPANVGISEGSYSIALSLLGYDPIIGLSVGIIRRFRSFVWSGIGALLLFYAGLIKKDEVITDIKK